MFDRFAPGKGLTVAVLVALVILVTLGTWQARKVGPKTALLERVEAGLSAEAIDLPVHLDDPLSLEYRQVRFRGELLPGKLAKVFQINLDGKPGYAVYGAVARPVGMSVIVNLGWVPMEYEAPLSLPEGEMLFEGALLTSATPGMMSPENNPDTGQWYTADVHELAASFGLRTKEYYHFRVFLNHTGTPASMPLGGQVRVDIPNNHLEYAFTWYGLGLSLLVVYVAFGISRGRKAP